MTLNVTQNTENITEAISKFVTGFNEIIDMIDDLTDYNAETEKSGVLLGSSTVNSVKSRLYSTLRQTLNVSGVIGRISQLGISVGSGAKLTFDQEKLEEVFNNDPAAVSDFLRFSTTTNIAKPSPTEPMRSINSMPKNPWVWPICSTDCWTI